MQSPLSPLPEYVSSCNSGKRSKEISSSFDRRQRESIRDKLFVDTSSSHSLRSTLMCSSDDRSCTLCTRVTCSTVENTWPNKLKFCAIEDATSSPSRCDYSMVKERSCILASSRPQTSI